MAKKDKVTFYAHLIKNDQKGGAWLVSVAKIMDVYGDHEKDTIYESHQAFSNASAGKRWIKEQVIKNTPRKNIKMIPRETHLVVAEDGTRSVVPYVDAKGKFIYFSGAVEFKEDVSAYIRDDEDDL
jgi:hypothetical protein